VKPVKALASGAPMRRLVQPRPSVLVLIVPPLAPTNRRVSWKAPVAKAWVGASTTVTKSQVWPEFEEIQARLLSA
jgi:hypothetical protein